MMQLTLEQLEKDRADLKKQWEQAVRDEERAIRQRTMLEGALQLLEIQMGRLADVTAVVTPDVEDTAV